MRGMLIVSCSQSGLSVISDTDGLMAPSRADPNVTVTWLTVQLVWQMRWSLCFTSSAGLTDAHRTCSNSDPCKFWPSPRLSQVACFNRSGMLGFHGAKRASFSWAKNIRPLRLLLLYIGCWDLYFSKAIISLNGQRLELHLPGF